jgi:predicted Zn-dependent protease with MMP-like domain
MRFEGDIDAPYSHLLRLAEDELRAAMDSLPPEIRDPLRGVPVIFEEFPSPEALADGIAPDQLGVFEGAQVLESGIPQPTRIVVWLGNIWDMCEAREAAYREEVRVTLLHEFGHFLGWDEEDLFDRGLE